MNERKQYVCLDATGTTTGNVTWVREFADPVRLLWVKAAASNDSSATLLVEDEDANTVVSATAIGDSYSAVEMTPASNAVGMINADKYVKFTLDYDGSDGTAAQNVGVVACFLVGDGA